MKMRSGSDPRWALAASLVLAPLLIVGCGTHVAAGKYADAEKKRPKEEEPRSGPEGVAADWIGFKLGLQAPKSEPARRVEVVGAIDGSRVRDVFTAGERAPGATRADEPPTPTPEPSASIALTSINAATGEAFTVSWDAVAADRILRAVSVDGVPARATVDEAFDPPHEPRPPGVRRRPGRVRARGISSTPSGARRSCRRRGWRAGATGCRASCGSASLTAMAPTTRPSAPSARSAAVAVAC